MSTGNRTLSDTSMQSGVHPVIVASTVAFALSRGLSMDQISLATGLDGQDLVAGCSRPPEKALPLIWKLLAETVPSDAPLTMEMAKATPFSFFADVAHGMQFADTVGDAVSLLVDHQRVLSDQINSELIIDQDRAVLMADHPYDGLDDGRTAEMTKALAWRLIRHLAVEPITPLNVEFAHAPTGDIAGYRDLFGVTPTFEAGRSAIVVSRSMLDVPIQHASSELFVYVKKHLAAQEHHLNLNRVADPLAPLKTAVIVASERGDFSPQTVARIADMGYRQAQRLAARHGTTLGTLIDQNRFELARGLLSSTRNTVESIALVLGFADDRAFRRAFNRVFGMSPSEYRRTNDHRPIHPQKRVLKE